MTAFDSSRCFNGVYVHCWFKTRRIFGNNLPPLIRFETFKAFRQLMLTAPTAPQLDTGELRLNSITRTFSEIRSAADPCGLRQVSDETRTFSGFFRVAESVRLVSTRTDSFRGLRLVSHRTWSQTSPMLSVSGQWNSAGRFVGRR